MDGYIAVHIRRGDVTAEAHPRRYISNDTYAPLLAALRSRHPGLPLVLFSQGAPRDFAELCDAHGDVRLCLDADVRTTFNALVHASALLVARSSFSYSAALLSRGAIYRDLIEGWWHQPLPSWERMLPK